VGYLVGGGVLVPPFPFCDEEAGGVRGLFPLDDSDLMTVG
jgi:hypothetical protein